MNYKDAKVVLEACEKATKQPWELEVTDKDVECPLCNGEGTVDAANIDGDGWGVMIQSFGIGEMIQNNAEFIILSRKALPYWVQEAERLRKENEYLKEIASAAEELIDNSTDTLRNVNGSFAVDHFNVTVHQMTELMAARTAWREYLELLAGLEG